MFKITGAKGFHIVFTNGITLSTQFGPGNYCQNRKLESFINIPDPLKSDNSEIAIYDKDGKWLTKEMMSDIFKDDFAGDVHGYITADDWATVVNWCVNYKVKITDKTRGSGPKGEDNGN
jgi:hypothetical protein